MQTTQLTFTRFIAAFLIFLYHFYPFNDSMRALGVEHLNLGVGYFYILSGFVMMIAYGNRDFIDRKEYWLNRVARIYPLHILTLILTVLVYIGSSINYLSYINFNVFSFIANALLIHSWFPSYSLSYNVPSWSISVEMFFYLSFPFIFNYFIKRFCFKVIFVSIIGFWMVSQFAMNWYYFSSSYGGYDTLDRYFLKYNPFLHFNAFLIGILFGYLLNNRTKLNLKVKNYDLPILFLTLAIVVSIVFVRNLFLHNGLFAIPFAGVMLLLSLNSGRITKIFNNKHLIYLGEISFSFYLLQMPISQVLKKIFSVMKINIDESLFFIVVLLVITLVCSHVVYKFIEVPMRDRIRKIKFVK